MATVGTAVATTHLLVGALWTGAVAFVALVVLPAARDGDLDATPLGDMVASLVTGSRVASLLMLLTGAHIAATRYTASSLTASTRGHLVLAMVALWVALSALVEVGGARVRDGVRERKVRTPARSALPFLRAAAVAAASSWSSPGSS